VTFTSELRDDALAAMTKGLIQHEISGVKLARIAIAGKGLGGQLSLAAVFRRPRLATEVGGAPPINDAKGERAARRYACLGPERRMAGPSLWLCHWGYAVGDLRAGLQGQASASARTRLTRFADLHADYCL
jgi:hypothetical protein